MNIKAVVFDMDGVILDSEKIYRKYEYVAAEKYGLPMDKVEDFCNAIAGGTKYTNSKVFDEFFQPVSVRRIINLKTNIGISTKLICPLWCAN